MVFPAVFPAEQSSSTLERVGTFLKNFMLGPGDEKKLPNYYEALASSLWIFLERHKATLSDLEFEKLDFLKTINSIYEVYLQLRNQDIFQQGSHAVYSVTMDLIEVKVNIRIFNCMQTCVYYFSEVQIF